MPKFRKPPVPPFYYLLWVLFFFFLVSFAFVVDGSPSHNNSSQRKRVVFVVGMAESGADHVAERLCINKQLECFREYPDKASTRLFEGISLQSSYPATPATAGASFSPLTEADATNVNPEQVYEQWLSTLRSRAEPHEGTVPTLVDYSEGHISILPFLQALFSKNGFEAHFIVVLSHPLSLFQSSTLSQMGFQDPCFGDLVKKWLKQHARLLEDLKAINSYEFIHYELFSHPTRWKRITEALWQTFFGFDVADSQLYGFTLPDLNRGWKSVQKAVQLMPSECLSKLSEFETAVGQYGYTFKAFSESAEQFLTVGLDERLASHSVMKRFVSVEESIQYWPFHTQKPDVGAIKDLFSNHTFVFVVGGFHTGTSLMKRILESHPTSVSGMLNTGAPEDEAQHFQSLYAKAREMGGQLFAKNPESHVTEDSPLVTDENRARLFSEWSPFWDLSKQVLIEKSPRHITMTRFFQAMFYPTNTKFIIILRHPFAAGMYALNVMQKRYKSMYKNTISSCGDFLLRNFFEMYDFLLLDLPHLENVAIVRFEDWMEYPQETIDAVFKFLNVEPSLHIVTMSPVESSRSSHRRLARLQRAERRSQPSGIDNRRRLLEFHGDKTNVEVNPKYAWSWVEEWEHAMKALHSESMLTCARVQSMFAERLKLFGYNIEDPTRLDPPEPVIRKRMVFYPSFAEEDEEE